MATARSTPTGWAAYVSARASGQRIEASTWVLVMQREAQAIMGRLKSDPKLKLRPHYHNLGDAYRRARCWRMRGHPHSAIVTAASAIASDGGFARYRFN